MGDQPSTEADRPIPTPRDLQDPSQLAATMGHFTAHVSPPQAATVLRAVGDDYQPEPSPHLDVLDQIAIVLDLVGPRRHGEPSPTAGVDVARLPFERQRALFRELCTAANVVVLMPRASANGGRVRIQWTGATDFEVSFQADAVAVRVRRDHDESGRDVFVWVQDPELAP